MLNTYDVVDPAGVTLLSLPDPGFGPEMNSHPAMVVSHSWETRMVDWGKATTSLLAPLNSYVWTIGPVTVALGT